MSGSQTIWIDGSIQAKKSFTNQNYIFDCLLEFNVMDVRLFNT
jgi:hypothetical protein